MSSKRNISSKGVLIGLVLVVALILILVSRPAAADDQATGDLYVYPAQGQSDDEINQDRFACHQWAVNESGFDPVEMSELPPRMVKVPVRRNPDEDATETGVIAGAIAGGILGAADHNAGRGAAIGATIGAIIGSEVEKEGRRQAREEAREDAQQIANAESEVALRRANYRRAITACLEGRGYTVR